MSIYLGTQLLSGVATDTISNAHTLFDFKWTDHTISSMEWTRADTFSWQDGTVYENAYNHLVADVTGKTPISETIAGITIWYHLADDGHKVCAEDQESNVLAIYNATGVAWYYILDTANQRFKLPRENPAREVLGQSVAVVGNGKTLGLTDGTNNGGFASSNSSPTGYTNAYGTNVGTSNVSSGSMLTNKTYGITTDPTKSGMIADLSETTGVYKGKQYLYFYVGQFSQSATEQTAGLNSELFNGKVDLDGSNATFAHIVETYSSGTSWYRIYSDGWCEQGGFVSSASGTVTVNFLKTMADTKYVSLKTLDTSSTNQGVQYNQVAFFNRTTTSMQTSTAGVGFSWVVKGFSA